MPFGEVMTDILGIIGVIGLLFVVMFAITLSVTLGFEWVWVKFYKLRQSLRSTKDTKQ